MTDQKKITLKFRSIQQYVAWYFNGSARVSLNTSYDHYAIMEFTYQDRIALDCMVPYTWPESRIKKELNHLIKKLKNKLYIEMVENHEAIGV